MHRRAHAASSWAIAAVLLAWLPILLFELLHPYPPARFLMSPILARGFLFAALVCLAVALPIGLAGTALGRIVARARGGAAAAASGMAAAFLASSLFLQFFRQVQHWAAVHHWPLDAGTAAAVLLAVLAAALPVGVVVLLAPRRVAAWVAGAGALGLLAYWLHALDDRFGALESPVKLAIAAPNAGALLALLAAASVWSRLAARWRNLLRLAVVVGGVALPLAAVVRQANGAPLPAAAAPRSAATSDINVVVLLIDTLRADHMSSWGYEKETTPAIERLLGDRLTDFVHAAAAGTSTVPSVKALFTALPPSYSGGPLANYPPFPGEWTMARAFRESGYATAGFSANGLIDGGGFTEGFDEFAAFGGHKYFSDSFLLNDVLCAESYTLAFRRMDALRLHEEPAPNVRRLYRRWLERSARRPFFLYVHFVDPHWPFYDRDFGLVPPELRNLPHPYSHVDLLLLQAGHHTGAAYRDTPELREMIGRYDSEIRFVDRVVGEMMNDLDDLGLAESTLVVLLADHGEEFFEHDGFSHGHDVYEEQAHVPLLVRWPKRSEFAAMPSRVETPVSLVDVLPTLTDYLSLAAAPRSLFGRSLRPLLEGSADSWPAVLSESHIPTAWRKGYRDGNLKARFTYAPSAEFRDAEVDVFDLATDPRERHPLPKKGPRALAFAARARQDIERRLAEVSDAP
jgi:arylsulfatase A-like enzyme